MPRKKYPSDRRRWFPVESAELAEDTADLTDAEFRAYFLIRAWANETRSDERENTVRIAVSRLVTVAPNRRDSRATATRVVRELCAKRAWGLHESDTTWDISLGKDEQIRGSTTGTKTKTKTKTKGPPQEEPSGGGDAATQPGLGLEETAPSRPPIPKRSPLINFLRGGSIEERERRAWFDALWPEIEAAGEAEALDAQPDAAADILARLAAPRAKSIMLARWRVYSRRDPDEREYVNAELPEERALIEANKRKIRLEPVPTRPTNIPKLSSNLTKGGSR